MHAHQTDLYTALLICCSILMLVFSFFALSIIRQQRRYVSLQRKTILAEITAMENERMRIAKDLHDDMGPFLSYIKFQVQHVEPPHEEDAQQLEDAANRIDIAIDKLREIAANMLPATLIRKGFITALQDLVYNCNQNGKVQLELRQQLHTEPPHDISINLYRVISEVVQNTLKHAGATRMLIDVRETPKQWIITCEDNGKGFDYEHLLSTSAGQGLRNIRSRTELMNGKIFVQSVAQQGTQYIFELPIQN